jgi:hypothetical protein
MGDGKTKVDEEAIAEVLGDMALIARDAALRAQAGVSELSPTAPQGSG